MKIHLSKISPDISANFFPGCINSYFRLHHEPDDLSTLYCVAVPLPNIQVYEDQIFFFIHNLKSGLGIRGYRIKVQSYEGPYVVTGICANS
jgi:hypothetical protein